MPAYPAAKTAAEGFSKAYSNETIYKGKRKWNAMLDSLRKNTVMIVDQSSIVHNDDNAGLDRILVHRRGYHPMARVFENANLRVYGNYESRTMIVVNRPWCKAGDSRNLFTHAMRMEHAIAVEGVQRYLTRKRGPLEMKDDDLYGSPLLASVLFQFTNIGGRLPLKTAAAVFRDAVTPHHVLACGDANDLPKTPNDKEYPTGRTNKSIYNDYSARYNKTDSKNEHSIYATAINISCNFAGDNRRDIGKLYQTVETILTGDGVVDVESRRRKFWEQLAGWEPQLSKTLRNHHESLAKNRGNRTASAATNAKKDDNNTLFQQMYEMKSPFWVVTNTKDCEDPAIQGTSKVGKYPCFIVGWETAKTRINREKKAKGTCTTAHKKAVKPTDNIKIRIKRTSVDQKWTLCELQREGIESECNCCSVVQ
mmetsp:Transcript_1964/g.3570  ORF Transcript_1964/g.3570 Transcript_1964/m.3570 type:complete len:423 (-) Transcript_1964:60-1328(-)